jgi:acetyl-CoA carboxylase biotin carboxyl carrier protein
MDLKKIKELIALVEESEITGITIEEGSSKIEIKKYPDGPAAYVPQMPAQIVTAAVSAKAPAGEETETKGGGIPAGMSIIKSPMTGTFYVASSPDVPPFVKAGDTISSGQPICIVEAMKTFNEIEAEVSGKIEKILVANATPVELGQPLFLIKE